ncbi:MAG: Asp-tRNA(Asn)/Glu-tRNA(Gln) amidotransferase subunit GatA [Bacilli bacterium]|nr:Asp-tRNA(Asn)/Glu-tRNA(Gln) amidotransferase subunit GatA [Bacilli bacterium]MBR3049135.1 Asp-tRNA(Asn)/Glu-tRNA(Gln) amidotransferase subunit GatA [Bacilli bacterium]
MLDKSIKEINELLKSKKIKPIDLVLEAFDNIEKNKDLNAYITLNKEEAIKKAKELEDKEVDNILFGLPIAIKDNIVTKDLRTTCASHILDNFIPIYDATVVEKIKSKNMIIIGKTNMDEFAMGSSSRTSYFDAPKNPWNKNKISGGSSGGSATTIAAKDLLFALGTDTGGSIRQPAAYTGIVGMKPTYGRVSRYGLVAFASSLDQIGPMTRNVYENAVLLNAIVGKDPKDLTSSNKEVEDFTRLIGKDVSNMKVAVPNYFMSDIVSDEIKEKVKDTIKLLEDNNVEVDYIDMKYLDKAVTLYQVIAMGEASSNLARYDGIRYGNPTDNPKDIEDLYLSTRAEGFGDEVKRRIMVGSYLLSGDNAKTYYNKALSIRDDMKKEFSKVFEKYDLIIGPTTTTTAYNLDEDMDDPLKSFMDDVLVIPINMAGLPAISIPVGLSSDKMPVGLHIIGNSFDEATIYKLASFIEKKVGDINE